MDQFITRADKLIEEKQNQEVFSDFSNSFAAHPITGRLLKVTNSESVKQAFRNRILSNFGEKLYSPEYGSYIKKSLFEPNDQFTKETIENTIRNSIQNDPRITLISIDVTSPEDHTVSVTIIFLISTIQEPQKINVILKRV